jgi:hypothetical protein
MDFLRKTLKKKDDGKGRKRLTLYSTWPKSKPPKEPINESSSKSNLGNKTLPKNNPDPNPTLTKVQRGLAIIIATVAIILGILSGVGIIDIGGINFSPDSNTNSPTLNNGENQVANQTDSISSWTGTYAIETITYWGEEPDCKSIITGEINFKFTKKSNGEIEGIATTKNDKEDITLLGDMPPCLPYLVNPTYAEGEKEGEQVPFLLKGKINDANGLDIDYFDLHMFEFELFTANRVDDTLTSKHVEVNEYSKNSETLTFSVIKE